MSHQGQNCCAGSRSSNIKCDELEVEVYVKVIFKIKTWDGKLSEHEADLPGHVQIKHLKEELTDELGDPKLSDWIIAKNNMPMSDEAIIYGNYILEHEDRINVLVHHPNTKLKNRPTSETMDEALNVSAEINGRPQAI